jgi:hypothetical protein
VPALCTPISEYIIQPSAPHPPFLFHTTTQRLFSPISARPFRLVYHPSIHQASHPTYSSTHPTSTSSNVIRHAFHHRRRHPHWDRRLRCRHGLLTRQARSNSRPSRAIGTSAATRITTAPTTKETAPLPVLTVRCRPVPTWTATNVGRASLARDR